MLDGRKASVSTRAESLQLVEADNAMAEGLAVSHNGDFGIFGKKWIIKISLFNLKSIICKYINEFVAKTT